MIITRADYYRKINTPSEVPREIAFARLQNVVQIRFTELQDVTGGRCR